MLESFLRGISDVYLRSFWPNLDVRSNFPKAKCRIWQVAHKKYAAIWFVGLMSLIMSLYYWIFLWSPHLCPAISSPWSILLSYPTLNIYIKIISNFIVLGQTLGRMSVDQRRNRTWTESSFPSFLILSKIDF
jgi:hypothetical protein